MTLQLLIVLYVPVAIICGLFLVWVSDKKEPGNRQLDFIIGVIVAAPITVGLWLWVGLFEWISRHV
jgi:hypothetical protein